MRKVSLNTATESRNVFLDKNMDVTCDTSQCLSTSNKYRFHNIRLEFII